MAKIAFLGPPGTFTEEALLSQPDLAGGDLLPIRSIPEVIAAVERGDADLGIVPIENSIEGSVNVTLDTLAFGSELLIQREVVLGIDLNLCARPGTELSQVKAVISHPHATAQCREWLARKLPGVEVQAANSTAEAAHDVAVAAKGKGKGKAAGARAAAVGCSVLENTTTPQTPTTGTAAAASAHLLRVTLGPPLPGPGCRRTCALRH